MYTGREQGFSLLECVVALALLGFALLTATSFLSVLSEATSRVQVHSEMLHELESVVELMRVGVLPLKTGTASFAAASDTCSDLLVTAVVGDSEVPGLFRISLRAECRVGPDLVTRSLKSQVWRP